MEAARSSESAPEQVIAARRLDSKLVKQRAKDAVECCSLGAAEFQRYAARVETDALGSRFLAYAPPLTTK